MSSYEASGVDVKAGDLAVELMKASIATTRRSEVIGEIGGFAGYFDASRLKTMRNPVLVTSTDGVGTKTEIAREMGSYATIGEDLVAMVVDDIVVSGAEPLFMTDYIAVGKVFPDRIAEIVKGIARGCALSNTALLGGETAEHPGLLKEDEFDIAGAATGVVEREEILDKSMVKVGDVLIAMASSGVHANGFSLVRHIVENSKLDLFRKYDGFKQELGLEFLTPTFIYSPHCQTLLQKFPGAVHGFVHVTGGGIAKNTARVIPNHLSAILDRSTWQLPRIFKFMAESGKVNHEDLELAFNCGVGMVVIVESSHASGVLEWLHNSGVNSWKCGQIVNRSDHKPSELINNYR
jgi:phosphoribosylformylglycinamidine cyclo-ligase